MWNKMFSIDNTSRTRSNGVKLRCKQVQLDCTKFFFTNDVVKEWNKLPPSVVHCDTIFTNVDASKLFSIDNTSRTKSNCVKLICKQVQLDNTKLFYTNYVVREWNKFPPSVVQCDTINSFKNKLGHHFLNQCII